VNKNGSGSCLEPISLNTKQINGETKLFSVAEKIIQNVLM